MLVPLFRLVGPSGHFYTTSAAERESAIAKYGFTSEGTACYVMTDGDFSGAAGPTGPQGPQGVAGATGPQGGVAEQMATIVTPSLVERRDRFAMAALASMVLGHYHAGIYIGDQDAHMRVDIPSAIKAADALIALLG